MNDTQPSCRPYLRAKGTSNMPHLLRSSDAPDSGSRAASDSEHAARAAEADADGAVGALPVEELDPFEKALRGRPEIVERLEAAIADPSKAVPSRHHPPPAGQ